LVQIILWKVEASAEAYSEMILYWRSWRVLGIAGKERIENEKSGPTCFKSSQFDYLNIGIILEILSLKNHELIFNWLNYLGRIIQLIKFFFILKEGYSKKEYVYLHLLLSGCPIPMFLRA